MSVSAPRRVPTGRRAGGLRMDFGDVAAWLVIPVQIFFVDLLLGADNALLIALACRSLGPEETRKAIPARHQRRDRAAARR